jgi:hypothetical protein
MSYGMKDSGWKYYLPECDETKDDACSIRLYSWEKVYDEESAAKFAADDEWSNRDGWERGSGREIKITVISPNGEEFTFMSEAEATVNHIVSEATK